MSNKSLQKGENCFIIYYFPMAIDLKNVKKSYTPKELADILGCSYYTILRYIKSGKIKAFKVLNYYRILEDDVNELIKYKDEIK